MTANTELIDCWNHIGIWGNERPRCPKLDQVIHCHNCNIYSSAGRNLLDRAAPDGYLDEWGQNLSTPIESSTDTLESALMFRIGNEWLCLPNRLICEIADMRLIHSIPHTNDRVLKGLINLRGELHLCVSLGHLIGLDKGSLPASEGIKKHERILVTERDGERYVFPVSEVKNIFRFHADQTEAAPATVAKAASTFIKGIINVDNVHVGCLDEELVFHALSRKLI